MITRSRGAHQSPREHGTKVNQISCLIRKKKDKQEAIAVKSICLALLIVPACSPRSGPGLSDKPTSSTTQALLTAGPTSARVSLSLWGDSPEGLAVFAALDGTDVLSRFRGDGFWVPDSVNDWQPRYMALSNSPESISTRSMKLDVLGVLADGEVIHEEYPWQSGFPAWNSLGSPSGIRITGQPALAGWGQNTASDPDRLFVFARGEDSNGYLLDRTGTAWSTSWVSLGGPLADSPAVISWGPGTLHVVAVGSGGDLLIKAGGSGDWIPSQTQWVSLGTPGAAKFVGRPAMVASQSGRLDIFARGDDNNLYLKSYYNAAPAHWVPAQGFLSIGPAVSDPVATTWGPESFHVAVLQPDGTLGLKAYGSGTWTPSQSGWVSLGAPSSGILGQPAMVAPRPNGPTTQTLDIAVFGGDRAVYLKRWKNGGWLPSQGGWDTASLPAVAGFDDQPFWSNPTMTAEYILTTANGSSGYSSRLLFPLTSMQSVTDARTEHTFVAGSDWTYDSVQNRLTFLPGSLAPHWMNQTGQIDLHDLQIAVTYRHQVKVRPPLATSGAENLSRTLNKLRNGQPLRMILFGDSISAGFQASGVVGFPPYQASWGELLARRLNSVYGSAIAFENPALAGAATDWGLAHIDQNVSSHAPDLVILAFGMNDASGVVAPGDFKTNIQAMVSSVRAAGPAEIILVSPILPIPGNGVISNTTLGYRKQYRDALRDVASSQHTALVDMTALHQWLVGWPDSAATLPVEQPPTEQPKTFLDTMGTNVNHPSDWLVRWYAEELGLLLVPPAAKVVEDTAIGNGDGQISYSGAWSTAGSVHYSLGTDTGAYALVKFTGTQIVVHGGRNVDRGIAEYAICDANGASCGQATLVDAYASSLQIDQVSWISPSLSSGAHTLRIRATNSKNAASSAFIVDVDRVVVSQNPVTVNDDDSGPLDDQITYSGTWSTAGSVHYDIGTTTTDYLLLRFTGNQVVVDSAKNVDRGIAAYSMCDASGNNCGPETLVDRYAPTLQTGVPWASPILSAGPQTLKIRATHTKSSASSGYIVDIDSVVVN